MPLQAAFTAINKNYTPFDITCEYDRFMNSVTGVNLIYKDRSGKALLKGASGEKTLYSGKFYDYSGLADISCSYSEETNMSVCNIKLRDDVTFSDGEKLTADDLLFTIYALTDPAYSGNIRLCDTDIKGLLNYRLGSSIADSLTEEAIEETLASEDFAAAIKEELIIPRLREEYQTVVSLYDDTTYSVYTEAYPDPKDLFAFFISIDSEYKPDVNESAESVISDIADMYGGNYKLFGSMLSGSESAFEKQARSCAVKYLTELEGASCDVNSISGIEKTGSYSLRITVEGRSEELIEALTDVVVAPLHHYGEISLFAPGKESFGFRKGTDFADNSEKRKDPLGAGAYAFSKYENGAVVLDAYDDYYKGTPETNVILITESSCDNAAADIADGKADVTFPDSTKEAYADIENANKSLKKIHLGISRNDGYGYIGINADNVCIGSEPFSEQSIMLRKAIATVINFYKPVSVSEYYGDDFKVTDYPVSTGFSLSSGEELPKPFSSNINGEPIYNEDMNETERYYEVKNACLGFLEGAGFTIENDRITEVPDGAATEFTAIVTGRGSGSHPSFAALTKTSRMLKGIGITLNVTDSADGSELWSAISDDTVQIWAGSIKEDLRDIYSPYSSYGIGNRMSELIEKFETAETAEEKEQAFIDCALTASDGLAVEIPMYKRDSYTAFSSLRIDLSTLAEDTTGSYDWTREIEKVKMK